MAKTFNSDPHFLRIYRAKSWLTKASQAQDSDTQFIALWISFNAVYARELSRIYSTEKIELTRFITQVCQLDSEQVIYNLVWKRFANNIRTLIQNRYVFQPFWDFHNGFISEESWREAFSKANQKIQNALAQQDTDKILTILFARIYTLRNQIIHGGASFNSSANRKQLIDSCALLNDLLPIMIRIVEDNPQKDWGKPFYPYIESQF